VETLQAAYTRGQLQETELDERIRSALNAKVQSDLSSLLSDLPVPVAPLSSPLQNPSKKREAPTKLMVHGGTVQKTGAWRVPSAVNGLVYKGTLVLDFRSAVITSAETIIKLAVYKGHAEIIVPRGYRVETKGLAYKGSWNDETGGGSPDGPVIVLKGVAYKAKVTIREADTKVGDEFSR